MKWIILAVMVTLPGFALDDFVNLSGTWKGVYKTIANTSGSNVEIIISQDSAFFVGIVKLDSPVPNLTVKGSVLYDNEIQKYGPFTMFVTTFSETQLKRYWRARITIAQNKSALRIKEYLVDENGKPVMDQEAAILELVKN